MRIKKLENQMNDYRKVAMDKKKKKDNTGAVNALRKAKMFEKQLATLQGQQIMLEQQSNMIQSTQFNQGVFEAMKEGKNVVDKIQAQVNVDEMADLQADLQE